MKATVQLLKALGFRKASKQELERGAATYVYPYLVRKHPALGEYFAVQIPGPLVKETSLSDITSRIRIQSEAHAVDRVRRLIDRIL